MGSPDRTWKDGNCGVRLAAWIKENGKWSFCFDKSYKDKATGQWKKSNYLFPFEIKVLSKLCANAYADYKAWKAEQEGAEAEAAPAETDDWDIENDIDEDPFA